jgi:subtilisin family serine protease
MRQWILTALASCCASVAFGQNAIQVSTTAKTANPAVRQSPRGMARYVVGVGIGDDVAVAAQGIGANVVSVIPGLAPTGLVEVPLTGVDAMMATAASDPKIQFVEPLRKLGAPVAPGCSSGDGFAGSGCIAFFDGDPTPAEYFDQPAMAALDVASLYPLLSGNLSVVAVIDTGIDASHSMLAGRVLPFGHDFVDGDNDPSEVANGLDDDGDGQIDEAWGHGTHVAGTIALMNPDARILPLRILDSDGNGTSFAVAEAVAFAVASGADVINLSLGMNGVSEAVRKAIYEAHEANVIVLAAAGNAAAQLVQFPARADDVVAVAAVDQFDQKTSFSSFGPAVEVSAPGDRIYSTMPGDQYAWWSGTSMATAVASGAVSLLHSLSGDPFGIEADKLLGDSSYPIDGANPLYYDLLGDGRIDPTAAAALLFYPN